MGVSDVGSPVVDMIEQRLSTRSGCEIASAGRSSRPSRRPRRAPASMPSAVEQAGRITGHVHEFVGGVDGSNESRRTRSSSAGSRRCRTRSTDPTSRLSNRSTPNPAFDNMSQKSSSHEISWPPSPEMSRIDRFVAVAPQVVAQLDVAHFKCCHGLRWWSQPHGGSSRAPSTAGNPVAVNS